MESRRVLIIDAGPSSLKFLAHKLKKAGHQIFTAGTGKEGLISAWRDRPHVIIIDPKLEDISAKELVEKLRKDKRTEQAILIALVPTTKEEKFEAVKAMNFDHVLLKEGDAVDKLRSLLAGEKPPQVLELPKVSAPPYVQKKTDGKIIAFLNAQGGIGTSSLCANLATLMAEEHADARIAVVDMVLPMGSLADLVGYTGSLNVIEVSAMTTSEASPAYLHKNLPEMGLWNFQFLAGSPTPQASKELETARLPTLFNAMRQAFDFVFIDLGRTLSHISLSILHEANQVVVPLSPEETAARLTRNVLDFLDISDVSLDIVMPILNRTHAVKGLSPNEIEDMLGIKVAGAVPNMNDNLSFANSMNVPLSDKFPDEVGTISLREIARNITQRLEIEVPDHKKVTI
ncbi:MAG: response regulator [Chloroflexi bacterium]|nr:MAG: response regulator [Chloroflexota bacterium]MBL1196869.1 response regulator [Chloroflexota bacterium]NOH14165.1 AAA family ATPase [Chloroflexota bacterium]